MRTTALVSSAFLVLGLAAHATAQAPEPAPTPASAAPASAAPAASSQNEQYGLNLSRIQRGLRRSAERQDYDGLNLRYYISVYAPAPSIRLFGKQDNLVFGPAPYGGPTHRDMMQIMTPQEFSAPAADLSSLSRWFTNKSKK